MDFVTVEPPRELNENPHKVRFRLRERVCGVEFSWLVYFWRPAFRWRRRAISL